MDAATIYHIYVVGKAAVQVVTVAHCCVEVYNKGRVIYRVVKPLKNLMKKKDKRNYESFEMIE